MITAEPLLVTLVKLVDCIPMLSLPAKRPRGRPKVYTDRLFLKALIIMLVRHLRKVHERLTVLAEPTAEMALLRGLLTEYGRYPTRRTWERRLKAMPDTLPAQIGCLGRNLVALLQPWAAYGRAVGIDSTILLANGGVWHKKDRDKGVVPRTSIDTEAHWTKSGWHGWCYGWTGPKGRALGDYGRCHLDLVSRRAHARQRGGQRGRTGFAAGTASPSPVCLGRSALQCAQCPGNL